ncbi:MAG: radical SAM protein [Spirochaetales bacterium]|nr:radical SAM protein [Spirochaetales bacterium]
MEWIKAKTILSSFKREDKWFGTEYNMNLYRGCPHGCIYCDSRSECYHVEDFDRVRPKERALEILERELGSRRRRGVIAMGAMSDPYNPLEKSLCLTRGALDLIDRARFGAGLATKSSLVTRDIPLFRRISSHSPLLLKITVTTMDESLASVIEPRVSSPGERMDAVAELRDAGLFAGVLLMPVLPFLEDNAENILSLIDRADNAGASFIFAGFGVTLRDNQRDWYYNQLDRHFPGLSDQYRTFFKDSYACALPKANALETLFRKECAKRNILYRMEDIIGAYRRDYDKDRQLGLF